MRKKLKAVGIDAKEILNGNSKNGYERKTTEKNQSTQESEHISPPSNFSYDDVDRIIKEDQERAKLKDPEKNTQEPEDIEYENFEGDAAEEEKKQPPEPAIEDKTKEQEEEDEFTKQFGHLDGNDMIWFTELGLMKIIPFISDLLGRERPSPESIVFGEIEKKLMLPGAHVMMYKFMVMFKQSPEKLFIGVVVFHTLLCVIKEKKKDNIQEQKMEFNG